VTIALDAPDGSGYDDFVTEAMPIVESFTFHS
jgi:hypothetical protein